MHAIVHGHVQGVGFRATACDYAHDLGLSGTVRNCIDGSVEIYAQGTRGTLDKLLSRLKSTHRIDSIACDFNAAIGSYHGFQIVS